MRYRQTTTDNTSYQRLDLNGRPKIILTIRLIYQIGLSSCVADKQKKTKKAWLSLEKTSYSLYCSCCSTVLIDLQGHPRSMTFILSESAYVIF